MEYLPRAVDQQVGVMLGAVGAVVLEGPRACGKTSTGLQHAASSVRLDRDPSLVSLAELNPSALLRGDTPRLIDEWQLAPGLWNPIRHAIDDRQARGQFLLSGSATPADDVTRHSGAGRFARIRMRTMSLAESRRSSCDVSLSGLGDSPVTGVSPLSYAALAEQAVTGGWPALLEAGPAEAIAFNRAYCDNIVMVEVPEAVGVRHDPQAMRRLLESVARNISGEATLRSLAADVRGGGEVPDTGTVRRYLDALTRVFALEELPAWSVALRSKSRLRTAAKLHLADPALACAVLGAGPDRLARDPEFFGQVFESMVIRDLRALSSAEGGTVYHYRDNTGLEVDAIIEYPDGRWGAVEVKLGSARIAEAEKNLQVLRDERVDTARVGPPAFMAVVTGTEYAYTLPSGVHVVPLGTLGP